MEIRSKEQFINLLLAAMAFSGTLVESFDFKNSILEVMQDNRFKPLFYFFRSLEDLDFDKILKKYMNEDFLITYEYVEDGNLVIRLTNKMFENEALNIYHGFNKEQIELMTLFLRENSLSHSLLVSKDGKRINGRYTLVNPNGIHTINKNMRIISNGDIKILKGYSVLVENAYFAVIEKLKKGEVSSFELLCAYEDLRYALRIIKNIIDMDIPIGFYEEYNNPNLVAERKKFEELKRARVYKYHIL